MMMSKRAWSLFWRLSPIVLAVALLIAGLTLSKDALLVPTVIIWTGIAVVSAVFADLVRRRSAIPLRRTAHLDEDNPSRMLSENNHTVAVAIELVHAVFLAVGLFTLFLPYDSVLRAVLSRDGILLGQYILMLTVGYTYLSHIKLLKQLSKRD